MPGRGELPPVKIDAFRRILPRPYYDRFFQLDTGSR
jgi:hypothetical protein